VFVKSVSWDINPSILWGVEDGLNEIAVDTLDQDSGEGGCLEIQDGSVPAGCCVAADFLAGLWGRWDASGAAALVNNAQTRFYKGKMDPRFARMRGLRALPFLATLSARPFLSFPPPSIVFPANAGT